MSNSSYDIAIIGGGLAGLTLSIQAANAGYSVALFEKESYPFHKVCGEYISLESKEFLQRLGLSMEAWSLPTIYKLETSDCTGKAYHFNLPLGGFGISRYKLDHELYTIALRNGVDVFTETKVTEVVFANNRFNIKTTRGDFLSSIAAGCYGKRSNLDVKLNRPFIKHKANKLNNYIGIKYHIRYPYSADTIALHNFEDGYCGMSQIEDGKSCLCYLTTAKNLAKSNNAVGEMERTILYKNKMLKNIFKNAEFIYDQPLAISQVSFNKKSQVEDHILMVGDSAGLITPLCGNGMSMAMHASKLAFEAVQLFLNKKISRDEMEARYSSNWSSNFSSRLFAGRVVQSMFGNSFTTSMFLKTMNTFPFAARQIIKSTHGVPF